MYNGRKYLAVTAAVLSVTLAACGGGKKESVPPTAAGTTAETTAEAEETKAPDGADITEVKEVSPCGIYRLESMFGLTGDTLVKMMGVESMDDIRNSFTFDLKEDGTAVFDTGDGDPVEIKWSLDGDKLTIGDDKETMEGTLSDGIMRLTMEDTALMLAKEECLEKAMQIAADEAESNPLSGIIDASMALDSLPQGTGLVSEEELQKGYVWMNDVADTFNLTYDDVAKHMGNVNGELDKEEFDDHTQQNRRYYKWISEEDDTHYIYVNFGEKDPEKEPGVYRITGMNTSGFTVEEARTQYLETVKKEAAEADKAAAANMAMLPMEQDIAAFGDSDNKVTVLFKIPESGWSLADRSDIKIVNSDDPESFGAGFIQIKVAKDMAELDAHKDSFENYKEIDAKEIAGIQMQGRTYKNIGYNWTEYIGALKDGRGLSVGIVDLDVSEGGSTDKILSTIELEY